MTEEEIEDLLEIGCCHYHMEVGEKANKEIKKLHSIIKEVREVLENKREKMTNQLLYVGRCDYEELLYQVDEEIGRILDKVEENK